jgi:LysM repeat protein
MMFIPKNGVMRFFLQLLTAILLVALIMLAWSISNWFVSLSEKNYAQVTSNQQSKLDTDTNTSPPPPETVIEGLSNEITVQRLEMPHNIESADTSKYEVIEEDMESSQSQYNQRISEPDKDFIAPVGDTLNTESQLTVDELTAEAPTVDLEELGSTALKSIDSHISPTEEDINYIQALREQFRNREQRTEKLSDEQLAKLVDHKLEDLVDKRKREDTHNKVYVVSTRESDQASDDIDELAFQKKVEALVLSSLKKLADEQSVSTPSKQYLQSLEKEAETRINEMRTIVVQSGDSLSVIAQRAYGDGLLYMKIFEANPHLGSNPDLIHVGQVLRVPF